MHNQSERACGSANLEELRKEHPKNGQPAIGRAESQSRACDRLAYKWVVGSATERCNSTASVLSGAVQTEAGFFAKAPNRLLRFVRGIPSSTLPWLWMREALVAEQQPGPFHVWRD
jgi:hypothetical protein